MTPIPQLLDMFLVSSKFNPISHACKQLNPGQPGQHGSFVQCNTEQRSRKSARTTTRKIKTFSILPPPISSWFLCPHVPLLLCTPNLKTVVLRRLNQGVLCQLDFLIMFCSTIFVYFSVVAVNFISKNYFFQQLSVSVRGFLFSLKLHLKNMLNSIFFQVVVGDRQTQLELSMVFLNSSAVQYNTKTSKTSVPSSLPVVTQMFVRVTNSCTCIATQAYHKCCSPLVFLFFSVFVI